MKNPFPGATELVIYKTRKKKKKKKLVVRDGVRCTCNAVLEYWTELHYMHDNDCIINTERRD